MTDITGLVDRLRLIGPDIAPVDPKANYATKPRALLDEAATALTAQSQALEEWKKRADRAKAALFAARALMMDQGRWENRAGYTTDVALWIMEAVDALTAEPITLASRPSRLRC